MLMIFSPWALAASFIEVLGIAQDGGVPHIGCNSQTCRNLSQTHRHLQVASLAIIDEASKQFWLVDASYHFPEQYRRLKEIPGWQLAGIFLTHAHIGHYTGLMFLGREALAARDVPVYAMPRMAEFLQHNGPWSQLVKLSNIKIYPLTNQQPVAITSQIKVTPIVVPHRDEYSETVGFLIAGSERQVLYIPDINKWQQWHQSIVNWIGKVDRAYLDATFYDATELKHRLSKVPHPLVQESMALFDKLPNEQKQKIYFIHFNHTNPLLIADSPQTKQLLNKGYHLAQQGARFKL